MTAKRQGDRTEIDEQLAKYARNYMARQIVQDPGDALGDPQLGSIVGHLSEALSAANEGRLYDVGCGHGSLLSRLAKLPAFASRPGWRYCPVDFEEHLDEVHRLARKLRLTGRTDELTLDQFATEPPTSVPKIFFCRNVLHELRIGETAELLHSVLRLLRPDDVVLIQDLLRFPEGERNNHCWTSELLAEALGEIGFSNILVYEQGTTRGNGWLNLKTRFTGAQLPGKEVIHQALLSARQRQWTLWSALEAAGNTLPERDQLIEALDLDLQLASLTRELRGIGGLEVRLDPAVERRIRLAEISRRIEALADNGVKPGEPVQPHAHFRERGAQMTEAETFLRSQARLAVVHGGGGTGKSTFLDQLLANRLYDKLLVRIEARLARGVWAMIEQMMAQLGVNLAADVISVLGDLTYNQLSPSIGRLLNAIAPRLVFVVEDLDEVLDSNQRFIDPQVDAFLTQVVGKDGIKVLVSSRREYLPATLHRAAGNYPLVSVRMGRYATTETVINVLDDYFDRAKAGLAEYPAALIDAIDRHPLVAALTGRILQQDGQGVLLDESFIKQVRQKLQVNLFARLVDGPAQAAMEAASDLRIPVPSRVLEALAGHESVHHARGNDIIYAVRDRRWGELLTPLGLFRKRASNDLMPASARDVEDNRTVNHARIAEQLERVYREDDDPKWLRESYYHRMLSGQTQGLSLTEFAGRYYFTELVASAGYCFDHHDYGAALALYNAALTLGPMGESALMRRASSMVRTGAIKQGSEEYRSLVSVYPNNVGMRRSHVDALLYKSEFEQAKEFLNEYGLLPSENAWHALQWARAELGLHNYARAIELFTDLRKERNDDPFIVTYLARALQQFGDLSRAIEVLQSGAAEFRDNVAILTALANNLERARRDEEARPLLIKLLADDAGNARAALSMVRILLREENRDEAQKVAKRAEREAYGSLKTFALMALAEVMLADGQPEIAADFLRDHLQEDEGVGAFIIDALLRAADEAEDPAARAALIRKAVEVRIPPAMAFNVPVQIVIVRLAVAARDRAAFDAAITNLAGTRIDLAELERQRALW
ncbi:tetratricopeptide repeat protein [Methylocystis sp. JR02]|uniref:tetratricopeptide repeat protein n=1 Tax=Methylocystis sp. JR02 TaxID=3046284 RepID=UPI0024BB8197|nr:tetratricopeptide repeat protein [Methylocystis sp. JR02]MDJ0448803.1 hypothetical protein [Methylocystis sp. JR02]